eukprot:Em0014g62a
MDGEKDTQVGEIATPSMPQPPPEYAKALTWTLEQQMQEMTRRSMWMQMMEKKLLSFSPRPTDVIIATSAKSGTTWVSHICHQIRTKGAEPDFENQVPDVTTLLEMTGSPVLPIDLNTMVQPAEPRIYCTHHLYERVPKGGKLIYCFRDQKDALFSFYPFVDSMMALKGRVSLPVFIEHCTNNMHWTANNLRNLLAWWEHRHDADVLFLFYDDLKEDHTGCVRRIAKFIGVDCDEETIARVVHTTTHAEMVKHHSKFDNHNTIPLRAKMHGDDPPSEFTGRVRKDRGKSGDGQKLPLEVQQSIDQEWHDIITAKLGFRDLKEMRATLKKEMDCDAV